MKLEGDKPLCMDCADLGELYFLPSGNMALTRRAKKYSSLWAVVVRFSRARKRYERQGLLVEGQAIDRAEDECAADEGERKAARERSAVAREKLDKKYIATFGEAVRSRFPGCPAEEAEKIAFHACEKHSGRVGRSAAAKELDTEAIDLAVRAHIRHVHTDYDMLLIKLGERRDARARVLKDVDRVFEKWRSKA
jgi:hypothetical protein